MLNNSKEFFFLLLKMLNCLKHLCVWQAEYYSASYLSFQAFFHQGLSVDTLYVWDSSKHQDLATNNDKLLPTMKQTEGGK